MEVSSITHLPPSERERFEEALSEVYKCLERGITSSGEVKQLLDECIGNGIFERLHSQQHVVIQEGKLAFSDEGRKLAEHVVRRQRLAERLLKDVLNVGEDSIDPAACQLEHILSEEVTDAICALLGHPLECPHGMNIPAGDCCKKLVASVGPLIHSLSSVRRGEKVRLAYFIVKDNPEAERLLSSGLVPGCEMEVIQTFPAYVIRAGHTQIAFDEQIAKSILVRLIK